MKKLVAAIRGRKDCRLKDLEMMTEFQHTSTNENINARHNVYFPKSYAFQHPQAVVRACLTAIDHNHNADSKQKIDVDGDSQYEMVSTRDGLGYKERKVMEPKNTTWRKLILAEVLEVREIIFFNPTPPPLLPADKIFSKGTTSKFKLVSPPFQKLIRMVASLRGLASYNKYLSTPVTIYPSVLLNRI
jgi:hypothetical protein